MGVVWTFLLYPFFPLSPSLWETARYRLKYCLKGPLNPKPTNQPKSHSLVVIGEVGYIMGPGTVGLSKQCRPRSNCSKSRSILGSHCLPFHLNLMDLFKTKLFYFENNYMIISGVPIFVSANAQTSSTFCSRVSYSHGLSLKHPNNEHLPLATLSYIMD